MANNRFTRAALSTYINILFSFFFKIYKNDDYDSLLKCGINYLRKN